MESRHHHHAAHSCHLKHHRNNNSNNHNNHNNQHHQHQPPPGGSGGGGGAGVFERYGGFPPPHISRIFPPISSSSSSSSTDSDIRIKRKFRIHRKWCACVFIAVLFVGIGAAAGIYFGYQFLSLSPAMEQLFRGSFTISSGDIYTKVLDNQESGLFKDRASLYKKIIDRLYSESLLKNAYLGSEILAFDGMEGGPLSVSFNIHVDTHRIRVDAGDLFITLAEAIKKTNGRLVEEDILIDQDSLEIQERSMEFLYLPSTERNYNIALPPNEPTNKSISNVKTVRTSSSTTISTPAPIVPTTPKHIPTRNHDISFRDHDHHTSSSEKSTVVITKKVSKSSTSSSTVSDSSKSCYPSSIDFCANITNFELQNAIDSNMLHQMRAIIDTQCYPFAAHFLCSWGISCQVSTKYIEPCKNYCEEFVSNCAQHIPKVLRDKIRCNKEWSGMDSCKTKPGCVEELYKRGEKSKICDGIMDCVDFSDELHCPYCPPGNFHCGAGKQCISPEKKCNGVVDCPNGSDEKACLTLAPSSEAAGYVHQYFNEGYLFVHDQGKLGKLCVERNDTIQNGPFSKPETHSLLLDNIGSSACELLGFRKVAFVRVVKDDETLGSLETGNGKSIDSTIGSYVRIQEPGSSSEVTFTAGSCPSKNVLYVGCNHLECGQRPSHLRKSTSTKGWVGHGDWPWHAALLRDNEHVCDATLVTSQWLVTSDHCFAGQPKAKWSVHFGRVRMSTISPWQQERRVVGMVKSPFGDSLVLIKMASPVIFSDFARHACLPDEGVGKVSFEIPSYDKCVRLGWNKDVSLIETKMHKLEPEHCQPLKYSRSYNVSSRNANTNCFENDTPGKDCLQEVKILPGGPIFCQNENTKEWILSGINPNQFYPKCGIEKYRVSSIKGKTTDWILKTIEALSNSNNGA